MGDPFVLKVKGEVMERACASRVAGAGIVLCWLKKKTTA